MADEPDALDQLLDAALYLPIGFLLDLRDRSPELAARGRQHLQTQISVARMIGQFAVQMGTKQVTSYLQRQREAAAPAPATTPATAPSGAPAAGDGGDEPIVAEEPSATEAPSSAGEAPPPTALPIDGYDTLAASQVVARLDGLDRDALEAVRAYEAAHRNRKTILGKVAQLLRAV